MKLFIISSLLAFTISLPAQMDYEKLAQDFLYTVRVEGDFQLFVEQLEETDLNDLAQSLDSENRKKAFWLNIYNAFIQIKAKANPSIIEESKNKFFTNEWIYIAGKSMSFDDIEHGMIRHSNWKYGMGYVPALFVNSFEKKLRVQEVDYRIHFALNCGVKGCPAVAFYSANDLDAQLDVATEVFLKAHTNFDSENNEVHVSKILSWFKGDFGGTIGIIKLLQDQGLIPIDSKVKLVFDEYDWTLSLSNYME